MASSPQVCCYFRGVIDETLSSAVVTYVCGTRGRPWPQGDVEAVKEKFGDESPDLIRRIEKILALVGPAPPGPYEELSAYTDRIRQLVRSHHPELSDEAICAIGNLYAFGWK